jgi:hypothetical protein
MMSVLPGLTGDIGIPGEGGTAEPFSNFLKKQRTLLNERDALIYQIQGLLGFGNFEKMPSFHILLTAASRGRVIIINHCSLRSDIILVLCDSPFLVPTAEDFYENANELADRLSDTRKKHGLSRRNMIVLYDIYSKSFYELVGQSVIDNCHEWNIPKQSRNLGVSDVSFQLSSPSCDGPDSVKRQCQKIFLRRIHIAIYPNTLFTHQVSRIQRTDIRSALIAGYHAAGHISESLRHHRLAHFTCYGVLEREKPFEASFILYGGERLTLFDIVRSQLPTAEFAFLSACHTAELTDGSIADEALHLTAAMQHCRFRSVVGTMWAVADKDGRDVAECFYKSMFSGGDQSIPYYERSSKALRGAVQKLRRKKGAGLERWVKFVHMGHDYRITPPAFL